MFVFVVCYVYLVFLDCLCALSNIRGKCLRLSHGHYITQCLLRLAARRTALWRCPALCLEVLLRTDCKDEVSLTDTLEHDWLRLWVLILLDLEARSTALARLHALCGKELLLLLSKEEVS